MVLKYNCFEFLIYFLYEIYAIWVVYELVLPNYNKFWKNSWNLIWVLEYFICYCRGNTPFCSQECRQEQIEIDEANERRWKVSSSSSTKRSNTKNRSNTTSDSRKESDHTNKPVRTGAVAVA